MKRTILASFVALFSFGTLADTYQHQSDLDYSWGDIASGDAENWSFKHQFFLAPVSLNTNVPYAEAAFMGRNASVNAGYSYSRFDFPGFSKFSDSAWSVGGEYMDQGHNFYGALQWVEYNGSDDRQVLGRVGYFVNKDWLVAVDVRHSRPDGAGSVTEYGVSTKKLLALDSGDFINIEARYMDIRDRSESEYGVAADYYFGKTVSLGLAYDWTSKDVVSSREDSFTVRGNWYVTPALALKASVAFDSFATGDDVYSIGASYRF
ncbi:putative porin [Chromatiaceae bacterium AAb-1]|nr:putative porin [Chromatiaceae bacterium AAb-1]